MLQVLWGCDPGGPPRPAAPVTEASLYAARMNMVHEQIAGRGIRDGRVLTTMARVPRHAFVPEAQRNLAYEDTPLPIGYGQTISQPFMVAFMTAVLEPKAGDRILEIGTGSGYQAAVLSDLGAEVFTVEIVAPLARRAGANLKRLGYGNVQVRVGDGYLGWPEAAPFDAIIVTCAPEQVPPALVDQLKTGGRMVIPVGPAHSVQELYLLRKGPAGLEKQAVLPVRFVPMVEGRGGD